MSGYEHRENSGSLFKNDRREKETHPNLKGSANIGGVAYWVSAWTKVTSDGQQFLSLAFTPKDADSAPARPPVSNDDIPF